MNLFARFALLAVTAVSQSAWADTGPYYVSYPGYCEVKKVYLNTRNDVYGTEIGCTSILGQPLVGSMAGDGTVSVATSQSGTPCIATYRTNGSLTLGCSAGVGVGYANTSNFVVRQSGSTPKSAPTVLRFEVGSEMPDLESTKNLPSMSATATQ